MRKNYRWLAILLSVLLLMSSMPGAALADTAGPYDASAQMMAEELFSMQREDGVDSITGIGGFDLGSVAGPVQAGISVGDWIHEGTTVADQAIAMTEDEMTPKKLATKYMAQYLVGAPANPVLANELKTLFDAGYNENGALAGFFFPSDLTDDDPWNDTPNHWGNMDTFDRLVRTEWFLEAGVTVAETESIAEYILSLSMDGGNQGFGGGWGSDYRMTAQAVRCLMVIDTVIAPGVLKDQLSATVDAALNWMETGSYMVYPTDGSDPYAVPFLQDNGSMMGESWDDPVTDTGEYLDALLYYVGGPSAVQERIDSNVTTPGGKSPLTYLIGLESTDFGNAQQIETSLRGLLAAGAMVNAFAETGYILETVGDVDPATLAVGEAVYLCATGFTLNGDENDLTPDSTYVVEPSSLGHVTKDLTTAWFVRESLEGGSITGTSPGGLSDGLSLSTASAWVRVEAPTYTLQPLVEVDIQDGASYDEVMALWADQYGHVLSYDTYGMISQVDGIDSVGDSWGYGPSWMTVDWQPSYHDGDTLIFSGNSSSANSEISLDSIVAQPGDSVIATVVDSFDTPVSVAEVIYYDEANRETPWNLGTTDADGELAFSIPAKGNYFVAAAKSATYEKIDEIEYIDAGIARTAPVELLVGDAVHVRIEGPDSTIEPGEIVIIEPGVDQVGVIDAWASATPGREYELDSGFISSIQGQSEAGLYWMVEPWQEGGYFDGDRLIFSGNSSTLIGEISVSDYSLYEGSSVTVLVTSADLPVEGAEVIYYTSETMASPVIAGVTDSDGELSVRLSDAGTYYLAADKDSIWPELGLIRTLPVEVTVRNRPTPSGIRVSVEVNGQDGRLYRGSVSLSSSDKYGETPLGALEKTGLDYKASGGFVSRIEDESNQGMEGWMYKVNGSTPMVASDRYELDDGDDLEWFYSDDLEALEDGKLLEDEEIVFEEAVVEIDGTEARVQVDNDGLILHREQAGNAEVIVLVGEGYELTLPADLFGDQDVLRILIDPASSGMEKDLRDFFEGQEGFYSNGYPLLSFTFQIGDGEEFEALGYLSSPAELRFAAEGGLGSPVGLRVTEGQGGELVVHFVPFLDAQELLVPNRFSAYTVANYFMTNELSITIGEMGYTHNGEEKTMDVAPFIQDGRTMVPLRFLSESLGAWVGWNAEENRASVRLGDETVSVVIDEPIEGFDTEAVLMDGRTFVPLSYINAFFDVESIWFPDEKMVIMERPVVE